MLTIPNDRCASAIVISIPTRTRHIARKIQRPRLTRVSIEFPFHDLKETKKDKQCRGRDETWVKMTDKETIKKEMRVMDIDTDGSID